MPGSVAPKGVLTMCYRRRKEDTAEMCTGPNTQRDPRGSNTEVGGWWPGQNSLDTLHSRTCFGSQPASLWALKAQHSARAVAMSQSLDDPTGAARMRDRHTQLSRRAWPVSLDLLCPRPSTPEHQP